MEEAIKNCKSGNKIQKHDPEDDFEITHICA